MSRESAEAKSRRLLTDGRLIVEAVDRTHIAASCRGTGAVHQLGYGNGSWFCDCETRGRCSHLLALMTVTVAPVVRRLEAAS